MFDEIFEERLETRISKDEFVNIYLEFKSRLEGNSRQNMMFLVETFRKTKQIELNIEKVEKDLNTFFENLETKSKFIIQKDIEKMKQNFLMCTNKINHFFQAYYSKHTHKNNKSFQPTGFRRLPARTRRSKNWDP